MSNEADTCRRAIVPKLQAAGWDNDPHSISEQRTITDGRIVPVGKGFLRKPPKRVDYLLRYTRDMPLAVLEAKGDYKLASDGMQQAKDYAAMLGLKFAYASNGVEILEFDFSTGVECARTDVPTPDELWTRFQRASGIRSAETASRLLVPSNHTTGKSERYYQHIAIQRTIESVLRGDKRLLLTMATGTGKTVVAFQTCWKLWSSGWNLTGRPGRCRILYLADRNILIDDPKDKTFIPFGDARSKIGEGEITHGREMYFGIYQALSETERRAAVFKKFAPDFFDLVIVDECHRGSAREDSAWRDVLDHFKPAVHLGMTATPLRDDNRNTYKYFGNPIYEYSLRQGIEDGFLAPYRVHRVITDWDAAGWRPSLSDQERYGRPIPDEEYGTKDFERVVALRARTNAIAKHLANYMRRTDRFAKTIVFCVDQEHASEMRQALNNENADVAAQHPDYACRVTADEKEIGRGHLSRFQDVDEPTPAILTTSQLLTTGVDAPTCKNVVLARVIGSMSEFKQIIGRGTRVRDDYGKLWFNIIDYTGSATRLFADPAFDGDPARLTEDELIGPDDDKPIIDDWDEEDEDGGLGGEGPIGPDPPGPERRKFYFDGGSVAIAAHLVYEIDPDGKQLRVVKYTDYAADRIRTLCPTAKELRAQWSDPEQRSAIIRTLEERGVSFDELAAQTDQAEADPFDLLCHLAFNAPLRTRRERAQRLKSERRDFFEKYGPEARAVLEDLLEKYAEHGDAQFVLPDALKIPPISDHGQPAEIVQAFGGAEQLRAAVTDLQNLLYAA